MTPHEAARKYAHRGWRVVPILPGTKRPALTRWTEHATTNPDTITTWWTGEHANCGIGIATGHDSQIFVLDVDDPDSLTDLQNRYQPLPDTLTCLTGSGGTHLYFNWPNDGRDIRNDAGRRLGPKLDIRGNGGQVVAPPTIHPNGVAYAWDLGQPDHPVDAPEWLLDLITATPPQLTTHEIDRVVRDDRPGDRWAAATPWHDLLTRDGWTLHHQDPDGECYWTRPGKNTRDGASATTGYAGSGGLKIFTSSLQHMGLVAESTYSKLGYLAATRHNGDHRAAATWLAEQGWGSTDDTYEKELAAFLHGMESTTVTETVTDTLAEMPDPITDDGDGTWDWIDLAHVLDGDWDPPVPALLARNDGTALLYPGKVHSLAGEPGGGKSWIALAAVAETINAGGTALYIDYEDSPDAFATRLLALGLTPAQISTQVTYVRPTGPLTVTDEQRLAAMQFTLVVIDSAGESLAVEGESPNDDDAVARWFRLLPRPLAHNGAAVLVIDHVTKNADTRGLWAIGSQRKMAALDGAAYALEVRVAPTKEQTGYMSIICAKDRHGTHQRGRVVAQVEVTAGTDVNVILTAPDPNAMPTTHMERVSEWLEQHGPASSNQVNDNVTGKKDVILKALRSLEELGHVRNLKVGQTFQWHFVSAFDPAAEAFANVTKPVDNPVETGPHTPTGSPVPTGSRPVPETTSGATGSPVPGVSSSPGTGNRPEPQNQHQNNPTGSHDTAAFFDALLDA